MCDGVAGCRRILSVPRLGRPRRYRVRARASVRPVVSLFLPLPPTLSHSIVLPPLRLSPSVPLLPAVCPSTLPFGITNRPDDVRPETPPSIRANSDRSECRHWLRLFATLLESFHPCSSNVKRRRTMLASVASAKWNAPMESTDSIGSYAHRFPLSLPFAGLPWHWLGRKAKSSCNQKISQKHQEREIK